MGGFTPLETDPCGVAELQKPDGAIGIDKMTLSEGGEGDVVKVHRDSEGFERV
jgi:hypothetical protein